MRESLSPIGVALELLQDCARETAAAVSESDVSEQVMEMFRMEDLAGISRLMRMQKLEREFAEDLHRFSMQWAKRIDELTEDRDL